jgi:hypothetical protein
MLRFVARQLEYRVTRRRRRVEPMHA